MLTSVLSLPLGGVELPPTSHVHLSRWSATTTSLLRQLFCRRRSGSRSYPPIATCLPLANCQQATPALFLATTCLPPSASPHPPPNTTSPKQPPSTTWVDKPKGKGPRVTACSGVRASSSWWKRTRRRKSTFRRKTKSHSQSPWQSSSENLFTEWTDTPRTSSTSRVGSNMKSEL